MYALPAPQTKPTSRSVPCPGPCCRIDTSKSPSMIRYAVRGNAVGWRDRTSFRRRRSRLPISECPNWPSSWTRKTTWSGWWLISRPKRPVGSKSWSRVYVGTTTWGRRSAPCCPASEALPYFQWLIAWRSSIIYLALWAQISNWLITWSAQAPA